MKRNQRLIQRADEVIEILFHHRDDYLSQRVPKLFKQKLKEYAKRHGISDTTAVIRLCLFQIVAENERLLKARDYEKIVWLGNYPVSFELDREDVLTGVREKRRNSDDPVTL